MCGYGLNNLKFSGSAIFYTVYICKMLNQIYNISETCLVAYIPFIRAGIKFSMPSKATNTPFAIACGVATYKYSTVGSTSFTRTTTKRELIASTDPITTVDILFDFITLSLVSMRLILHPVIAGVLHATSHVNSNVLLSTLLQVTLYIEVVAELKSIVLAQCGNHVTTIMCVYITNLR